MGNDRRPGRRFERLEDRWLLDGDPVILRDDSVVVTQNSETVVLAVMDNDLFPDDYAGDRVITSVSFGTKGADIQISPDRQTILYKPTINFVGDERFIYFIDDSFHAEVRVDVRSPLRNDTFRNAIGGVPMVLDVLANDGEFSTHQITHLVPPNVGQIINDGSAISYVPERGDFGSRGFTYVVDGRYTGQVRVHSVKLAFDDEFEIWVNPPSAVELDVLANDPVIENLPFERRIVRASSWYGSVIIAENEQSLLYQPNRDFIGTDRISYVVDGQDSATAVVKVTSPLQNQNVVVDVNAVSATINVIASPLLDVDRITGQPQSEIGALVRVSEDGRSLLYTPPRDFNGVDKVSFEVDGRFPGQITVVVNFPVRDDRFYRVEPISVLDVLANDFSDRSVAHQITSVGENGLSNRGGKLSIVDNKIRYEGPFDGRFDQFRYQVDHQYEATVFLYLNPYFRSEFPRCWSPNPYLIEKVVSIRNGSNFPGEGVITRIENAVGGRVTIDESRRGVQIDQVVRSPVTFDYVVDDVHVTHATFRLTNRLDNDEIVAEQNSDWRPIDVLKNDSIFGDGCHAHWHRYTGQFEITSVSASDAGGDVRISNDGKMVEYRPPTDFLGYDKFTYEVDGIVSATVMIEVVSRTTDDEFHVPINGRQELPVLANDALGSDYAGPGRITRVEAFNRTANAAISNDGQRIVYVAPPDFEGIDYVSYTVDNQFPTLVRIHVTDRPIALDFQSPRQLVATLAENASADFGESAVILAYRPATQSDGGGGGAWSPRPHSETNVQQPGVEEGDIVEVDADYVYKLDSGAVQIIRAWHPNEMQLVSKWDLEGEAVVMYLDSNRLTVVSGTAVDVPSEYATLDPPNTRPWPPKVSKSVTVVTVLDITDRATPKLIQKNTFDGAYLDSRSVDGQLMLVLRNQLRLPPPAVVDYDPTAEFCAVACDPDKQLPAWADGRFETKEEYQRRVQEDFVQVMDGMVPRYTTAGASGQLIRSGQLTSPNEIYRTDVARPVYSQPPEQNLVSVVSMNLRQNTPGITDSVSMMIHDIPTVYASLDHIVLTLPIRNPKQNTQLFQIGWDRRTGQLQIAGIGRVAGYLSNQFSLDERDVFLRLATTATNPVTKQSETNLFVLKNDHGLLEPVSGVHNLSPGNVVRFSRFDGNRALISTRLDNRQSVNTLITVDLSDPEQPQLVGSAEISGDFSYLEIIGPQHLLAVGRNAMPSGRDGPLHVTLFQITDSERPRISDAFTFERFSFSSALSTHLANGYFAQHRVLALPFSQTILSPIDADGDGFRERFVRIPKSGLSVLKIDPEAGILDDRGIKLQADVELPSNASRVGFIDDVLFAFGYAFVAGIAVEDGELLNVIDVQATTRNRNITQIPQSHSGLTNSTFRLLRDLATDANVPVDGFTIETLAKHAGITYAVASNFNKRYLFVQSEGTWRLADANYNYPPPAMWHNDQEPLDVNRDGTVDLGDLAAAAIAWTETQGIDYRVAHRIPIRPAETDQAFDVNGDLQFSEFDVRWMASRLVQQALIDLKLSNSIDELAAEVLSHAGDANGDGVFNSRDLVTIFQSAEYEDAIENNSTWSEGDWNGDGDFTTADLVVAFQFGRYSGE